MISNELLQTIDWRDYINDYKVNNKYNSSGIKIQSKIKDINELNIDELYHLDDPQYQYCMFSFEFDLRYTNSLIGCLLNGKSFSYYYERNEKSREIVFEFDIENKILTRHFKNLSNISNSDNVIKYNLNDNYIVAIIKFVMQRSKDIQTRDSNKNIKEISTETKREIKDNKDKLNSAMDELKLLYDNNIQLRIKGTQIPLTVNGYDQILYELLSEFRNSGTIKNMISKYISVKDCIGNEFEILSSKLWEYKQSKLIEYEEQIKRI